MGAVRTFVTNARWELLRLRRSRRIWLLTIPLIAGPIGSTIADLYLKVPSPATGEVLGLLVVGGLSALVVLDLSALAVGEDLALRTHFLTLALPQGRAAALVGRLGVVVGGSLGAYAAGAAAVVGTAAGLVPPSPGAAGPILLPTHLALGLVGLLIYLAGITAAAAVVTRSSASALVTGVLGGILAAGIGSSLLIQHQLTPLFAEVLCLVGAVGLAWATVRYSRAES